MMRPAAVFLLLALAGCAVLDGATAQERQERRAAALEAVAGPEAKVLDRGDGRRVLARRIDDDGLLVALVNEGTEDADIDFRFADLGTGGAFMAHDCRLKEDEGVVWGQYCARIPAGSAKLVRFRRVHCPRCTS